ncbi:tetratricopeptide repeat protein [Pedobacter sp. HMF7647]|uniref:Tetratricopeptide repeat protein n=1 Tax=Hufsiella arboris TaxID=2695275 RepID=A0A7K1YC59_9SPHI|nr:tetratricopeptide repeat protein [Hufsiella arboris]MXV51628.1 tetratricopeptide repeat protein [Hufsiella arboris]
MEFKKKAIYASIAFVMAGTSVFAQDVNEAKKAIDAEQYQKAEGILKKLVASQPTAAENYFFLGDVYLKNDYPDSAKMTFNKGVAAAASSPLNYIGLGAVELENNNAAGAKTNFDKAASLAGKKDNKTFLYIGKAYVSAPKPDYNTALTFLNKAKAVNEKDGEVFLALGDAHRGLKDNSAAYSDYRTAYDLDKNLLRSKIGLGIINKQSKAFKESTDEFNGVIALNANYGPAYRELAETYYLWANNEPKEYDARIKQAVDYYKKYLDLTDRSIDSRMRYADFLYLSKDYKALIEEAKAMSSQQNANARVYRYLGYADFQSGDYAGAVQALNTFISKADTSRIIASDYLNLGQSQIKAGDKAAGIASLKKAIAKDSTNAAAMSEVGKTLYDSRNYAEAADAYEIAIKDPKTPLLDFYYLGVSHYFDYGAKKTANQNPDKQILVQADSAFSKLLQRSPTTEQALLYRGRIHRLMDDEQDSQGLAVPYFEQFIQLVTVTRPEKAEKNKTGLVESYLYLGSVAARKDNNVTKAKEYFNKALALDPANAPAQQAMKAISGK